MRAAYWIWPVVVVVVALPAADEAVVGWTPLPATVTAPRTAMVRLGSAPGQGVSLSGPWGTRVYAAPERLSLVVEGGASLEVEGSLSADRIDLRAHRIHVRGELVAAVQARLVADHLVEIEAAASLAAPDVEIEGAVVSNVGRVSADGLARGGHLRVTAGNVMNQGLLGARGARGDGGRVDVSYGRYFAESARGSIDASGDLRGGSIRVVGPGRSHLFTSGTHLARGGRVGGRIALDAADVKLVAARLDASGARGGGSIAVGTSGARAITREITVRPGSELHADGEEDGSGGQVLLASLEETSFGGRASARAGTRGGNGGLIDVSSKGDVLWRGELDAAAPVGRAGRVLVDPKNITISDTTGQLLQWELVDPTPDQFNGFGVHSAVLSTGNVVVTAGSDGFGGTNAGAVHLFSGKDGALLATLFGTSAGDGAGFVDLDLVGDGNYVVRTPLWDNGAAANAGAVTWGSGTTGVAGAISASNSLVGSTTDDAVFPSANASMTVTVLSNRHYVVAFPHWNNGATADVGTVIWCDGAAGCRGPLSPSNSLVGATAGDTVGTQVVALTNANYVIVSKSWDNGATADAGALTWADGTAPFVGVVSTANSLVGAKANDLAVSTRPLTNGNLVVWNPLWANGSVANAGAVTWVRGNGPTTGVLSAAMSLVGSKTNDFVAFDGVTALSNGNYVIRSISWSNGGTSQVGAITWGNGATGTTGVVSSSNSLVGAKASDQIGSGGLTALTNGNYVVLSPNFPQGSFPIPAALGAVTWGNGATGTTGTISFSNSLVGGSGGDLLGAVYITPLTNGNYVVAARSWDNPQGTPQANAGAVTWCNGSTGRVGSIGPTNSLVGTVANDAISDFAPLALPNGNYLVRSYNWNNGAVADVGAVTWGNGATGLTGTISASNSLIGSTAGDRVGGGVVVLPTGNYVVASTTWDNAGVVDAGAAVWGNGATGTVGTISAANGLVGSSAGDGSGLAVTPLVDGNYLVQAGAWDDGSTADAGAVTWGNGATGTSGVISPANSVVGSAAGDAVGACGTLVLPGGDYVVCGKRRTSGGTIVGGSMTPVRGGSPRSLRASVANSLVAGAAPGFIDDPAAGPLPGTFLARTGSRFIVGAANLDGVHPQYGWRAGDSVTVHPSLIASTLSRGLDVTLEASNDITVASPVLADNPNGAGGSLRLAAGRSISVGAGLATDGGNLTLIANDLLANGVVDGQRDLGPGGVAWTGGVGVDVGGGMLQVYVRDGAGKTNHQSGTLQIGDVQAGAVIAHAQGAPLALVGNISATGAGSAILLASDASLAAASATASALLTPNGRFLLYAPTPSAAFTGALPLSFEEFEKLFPSAPEAAHSGSGILYASAAPPVPTHPTVSVEPTATQVDPTSAASIAFDVTFDQDVTGFADADVDLTLSTADGPLVATVTGGPSHYLTTVTGMTGAGTVTARVPAGSCAGVFGGLSNQASTGPDGTVNWVPPGSGTPDAGGGDHPADAGAGGTTGDGGSDASDAMNGGNGGAGPGAGGSGGAGVGGSGGTGSGVGGSGGSGVGGSGGAAGSGGGAGGNAGAGGAMADAGAGGNGGATADATGNGGAGGSGAGGAMADASGSGGAGGNGGRGGAGGAMADAGRTDSRSPDAPGGAGGSGCSCSTTAATTAEPGAALLAFAGLALIGRRRRSVGRRR